MARIHFSMSGEWRGHATRVRAVVEALRPDHEITLHAWGDAHGLLAPLYADTEVRVREIEGLRFHYNSGRKVAPGRTAAAAARFIWGVPGRLERDLAPDRPDLVVVDFEPLLPRVARRLGVPFLSLTHQHFLLTYDLSALPRWLRWHTHYMKAVAAAYYQGQSESIVSSFYFPPLCRSARRVTQVGILLRPETRHIQPADEGHLLDYLRRFAGGDPWRALEATRRPVRIYGLGARPAWQNFCFREINEGGFLADLATCSALISTAGNQLVGEALYWRKPSPGELTRSESDALFTRLPRMDAVRLTGGEPFVRSDLLDIAHLAADRLRPGFLHITTNGFLTDRIVAFCEQRPRDRLLRLLISLFGIGEYHNRNSCGLRHRWGGSPGGPNPPCVALNAHLRILPNGDVPVCRFNTSRVGNLRQQSLDEIWHGPAARSQRDWVRRCAGCWAECAVIPNAVYSGDLLWHALRRPLWTQSENPLRPLGTVTPSPDKAHDDRELKSARFSPGLEN